MLSAWNDVSLQFKMQHGHPHAGSIPLNSILRISTFRGDTTMLDWLFQLPNPWEPLRWDVESLLCHNLKTASWAMRSHSNLLNVADPHRIVRECLSEHSPFLSRRWLTQIDEPKTLYHDARRSIRNVENHARNLMHLYFRDMPWQERWRTFVDPLAPVSPNPPSFNRDGIQGCLTGSVYISGLLYNAPEEVQKCLAAFKRSHHPNEDESLYRDTSAKAIRHTFFGDPAPLGGVEPKLAAWLSIMQGTPVQQASNDWILWQGRAPDVETSIALPLPSDGAGL